VIAIARIEAHVAERPHREVFEGVFGGRSSSVVVEVELEDGRVGLGEATLLPGWSGESADASLLLLEHVLSPALIGLDAAGIAEPARSALAANNFLVWAVEAAALDALGARAAEKPVPVRGLIGRVGPETASRLAGVQTEEGHRRLKVKLAGDLGEDEARLRAVRAAAPEAAIVADANEAIAWEELPAYGPIFSETSVAGVEQPCTRIDVLERGLPEPDGWAWVADESIWGYEDALALRDGPWQVWTLHPGKCRGEDVLRRVADVAVDRGIAVVLGSNVEFGPGAAALCRVAAGLPDSDLQLLLGHDLAGPLLVEGWSTDALELNGDEIRWKEAV
jgi:L-alanine-DL-glutamate epimerase-like enolase superfamily enzyme